MISISITPLEINQFILEKGLTFKSVETPIGDVVCIDAGGDKINLACPYESVLKEHVLWAVNGEL